METLTNLHGSLEANPSVIVGMACRVPGAKNPSQLWEAIVEQKDLRRKTPEDRFNVDNFYHPDGTRKGTTNARYGYFLDQDIGEFDASFFGISGKEAEAMDPQQRLLLEVVYEALEDAGITMEEINGSSTAVLCGCFTNDYSAMLSKDLESYPKYTVTGTGNSILANRISYFFNLHGMSLTVDTACSSSLVCFHLANKLLLDDEAEMSIVVGSALHFDPAMFITMADLGMLSPDGRSKAFDTSANGYARGEGICAVVLKRQRAAEKHGDNIRAIVRATGSNHDGRKQGITLPNSAAQEKLIRQTYQRAGLSPLDTQYFEAHGTGTQAGDPIESRAVGTVFSPGRDEPLRIGSLKGNIGHLEGASGLASIIKTTMSLEKAKIPPNMHFNECNPKIDLQAWKLEVPKKLMDWPEPANGIRRASINSFGYGGANAHVVLEEYCKQHTVSNAGNSEVDSRLFLLPITSHSDKAAKLWEQGLANYLGEKEVNISDLAFTLSTRRSMNINRSFIVADTIELAADELKQPRAYAPWVLTNNEKPRLGFVFTGQGAQWHGMGRELIHECAVFKHALERCDSVLQLLPDPPSWTILQELSRDKDGSRLNETLFSQTICTAVQLALLQLLRSWGITPTSVVGHSSGEVAAAYAAGILSFESAIVAAYYRGRYMSSNLENQVPGAMMAVGLTETETLEMLESFAGRLVIAAVNSSSTMTISGDEDAIVELKEVLDNDKIFNRRLQVKQAFHSHHMLPLASAYESALRSHKAFTTKPATCRMFSTVTARLADHNEMGPEYWAANMTEVVRFSDGLTGILLDEYDRQNVDVLVELGPHPVLRSPVKQIAQSLKMELPYFATLTRGTSGLKALLTTAGQLFSVGYPVDLAAVNNNTSIGEDGTIIKQPIGKRLQDFPSYRWDHSTRYWSETRVIREHRLRRFRHSLLGHIIPGTAADQPQWRNILRISELPWLSDHVIEGRVVFPAAGYLSMAIEAIVRQHPRHAEEKSVNFQDVVFKAPLILTDDESGVEVLLALHPTAGNNDESSKGWYKFNVYSYTHDRVCTTHCWGLISVEKENLRSESTSFGDDMDSLRKLTSYSVPSEIFYRRLEDVGLQYGATFRLLSDTVDCGKEFAMAPLRYDARAISEMADDTIVHPTFLDASFHIVFSAIESCMEAKLDGPYVPSSIKSISLSGFPMLPNLGRAERYHVCAKARTASVKLATSDLLIQSEGKKSRIQISGLEVTSLGRAGLDAKERELFFQQRWLPCYDLLDTDPDLDRKSLGEIVEIFAHQYPNSRILYLADTAGGVMDVARRLGIGQHIQRRIQRLDIHITSDGGHIREKVEKLIKESDGLLHFGITDGQYSLVVVDGPNVANRLDLHSLINTSDNVIICDTKTEPDIILQKDLLKTFSTSKLTAYSRNSSVSGDLAQYTVVLPSNASDRIQEIANSMDILLPEGIQKEIGELETFDMTSTRTLVVLATLDGPPEDEVSFLHCRKLLSNVRTKVIWLLNGATMNSPEPQQSILLGLLRAARSENEQLSIQVLDVDPASTAIRVTKAIHSIQKYVLNEDELTERGGCVYLPRIQVDDMRNRNLHLKRQRAPGQTTFQKSCALFEKSKTYLLVGGLGGIGRTLSQWMMRRGARKLAFLSRTGVDKPAAKATIQWLAERNVTTHLFRGDVANMVDVQNCISAIGSDLGGIFHAAMVTNDSMLDSMSLTQWQQSLEPKVKGAQNLHAATLNLSLDFFVCFSSTTSVLGVKGLANYCAANLFLDAMMRCRREMKLCGTAMNIGALVDVGVLAENKGLRTAMERLHMDFITEDELFQQLEDAVTSGRTQARLPERGVDEHQTITGINVTNPNVYWASKSLFRNLYSNRTFGVQEATTSKASLHATLSGEVGAVSREQTLLAEFIAKISTILCIQKDYILPNKPLSSYGLDSLVAAEIRKWFRHEVQIDIPLFDILAAQPIRDLVSRAAQLMKQGRDVVTDAEVADTTHGMDAAASGGRTAHQDGIERVPKNLSCIPMSTYQSRLWYLHNMSEDKSSLNLPIVMHISGRPDKVKLQQALAEFTRRNETFRMAYFEGKTFSQQRPVEKFNVGLLWKDVSTAKEPLEILRQIVARSRCANLDVSRGQMATWCLVKLEAERFALVAIIHHLAVDRGSHKSVLGQLVQLYNALGGGNNLAAVPKPALTYTDFTVWHNAYLQSPGTYNNREWWKSYLAEVPSASRLLPFASVKKRPKRSNTSRAFVKTHLDDRLLRRLKRIVTQLNATAYHFLLAAFRAFLYRYTEDEDLVILIADGTRPHPDADDIVGFFVNMCPVRCNDSCETTFEQLLRATRSQALEVMAHSSVPFDVIVDTVRAPKTTSYAPLAQVAMNYQIHGAVAQYETDDFVIDDVSMSDIPTACELSLEALERNNRGLDLRLEYATELYGEKDMERFIENFATFLSSIIKDHRQPIAEVEVCGKLELNELRQKYWNMTSTEPLWNEPVINRILCQGQKYVDNVAVLVSNGESITYGKLFERASLVAHSLHSVGVSSGDRVAVISDPGIDTIVGMLATLMVCGCFVALDMDFARERLSLILQDTESKALYVGTGAEYMARDLLQISATPIAILYATDERIRERHTSYSLPEMTRLPSDPFYMIYTSGSTGVPKGVVIGESNVQQMLSSLQEKFAFSSHDRFLHQSSVSFDTSIAQIFPALCSGATLCIASSQTRRDPAALADFMEEQSVTVTYFTPTHFSLLLESNIDALRQCKDYRVALFNGEILPVRVVKAVYDLQNPAVVFNGWCPSEVTVQTTIARIPYPHDITTAVPIGHPLDNCRHYILDKRGNPLPVGLIGEIAVGGAQVGQGYLNRVQETRRSFVTDPFCSEDDQRNGWTKMFKTGDRGRFLSDGQIEFHGRIEGDKQIKLRGFRIDLSEIEHYVFEVWRSFVKRLVDVAAVIKRRDGRTGDSRVVCFLHIASELSEEDISTFVTKIHTGISPYLNHYMLPDGYCFLSRFPMTASGKVNRLALQDGNFAFALPSSTPLSPVIVTEQRRSEAKLTALEASVLEIFQSILGGAVYAQFNDNFFQKGGNSFLLVRLHAQVRRVFNVAPKLLDLFQNPTAAAVSTFLKNCTSESDDERFHLDSSIDWVAESSLPLEDRFVSPHKPNLSTLEMRASDILIAGEVSKINTHILFQSLVRNRTARIFILSLDSIPDHPRIMYKLRECGILYHTQITEEEIRNRVCFVQGTLLQPKFGLDKQAFQRLGGKLRSIYFLGGEVSLLQSYSYLKTSNVIPMLDLIELAGSGGSVSSIHYLSTWSVAHLQRWPTTRDTIPTISTAEQAMTHFIPPPSKELGYFKARWVAEKLLIQAASRGFPATITRTSTIFAPSHEENAVQSHQRMADFSINMVKSIMTTKIVPRIGSPSGAACMIDIIPVDYMASALVALTTNYVPTSRQHAQIFHLGNPSPLKLEDLPAEICGVDTDSVATVSVLEWLESMKESEGVLNDPSWSINSTILREYFHERSHVMFSLDSTNTMKALQAAAPGLADECPPVTGEFLEKL